MKKTLLFLLLCVSAFASAGPLQERALDRLSVAELAAAFGMEPGEDLIAATQAKWLRKPHQERWDLNEISPELRRFVLNWTQEQHLLEDWLPAQLGYDQALILGATTARMQMRLDFLANLWEQGVRFKEILWLTGDRPLDPHADGLLDCCANESDAARIIWERAHLPKEMNALPVRFIAVPMKEIRPTTGDTIKAWLSETPEPCRALFVSDQPFCGYQFAIVQSMLPQMYDFDLVGKGADPSSHPAAAAIILDSIARWLYQEGISYKTQR